MDENTIYQHAVLKVRVAVPVLKTAPKDIRKRRIETEFENGNADLTSFHVESLDRTETHEERAERRMAEAEAAAEAEAQRRYERWLDNGKGRRRY